MGAVDAKVAAATAIDDRRAGERTAWLAAARTRPRPRRGTARPPPRSSAADHALRRRRHPHPSGWARCADTGAVDGSLRRSEGLTLCPPRWISSPHDGGADSGPWRPPRGSRRRVAPAGRHHVRSRTGPPRRRRHRRCLPSHPVLRCLRRNRFHHGLCPTPLLATDHAAAGWAGQGIPPAAEPGLGSGGPSALVSEIIDAPGGLFDEPTDEPTDDAGGPADGDGSTLPTHRMATRRARREAG